MSDGEMAMAAADLGLVRPETLRHQVENVLRQAIVSGRYAPGARLVERELCETLGVSRTSVREALRRLEAEKLVRNVPHKGPVVAVMSRHDAHELYALRGLLEGFAAHEFARLGSDDSLVRFAAAARELREAARGCAARKGRAVRRAARQLRQFNRQGDPAQPVFAGQSAAHHFADASGAPRA